MLNLVERLRGNCMVNQETQDKKSEVIVEDDRTGLSTLTLRRALADNLYFTVGKLPPTATTNDFYLALAYTVRDRLLRRWLNTIDQNYERNERIVCYLSAEFLLGPHLENNMLNLHILEDMRKAVTESGLDFDELIEQEEEPGLGNGGLGRLAACYMDSMATNSIPSVGFGIRYEFGIFDQEIRDGWQVEVADRWLHFGNPWELPRPEAAVTVRFGGKTVGYKDKDNRYRVRWEADREVRGIPYDTPIPGYGTNNANTLRLWKAEAPESFDFQIFNMGDYLGAVTDKLFSENISKVLYPNDNVSQGRQLRLEQQYFFVSCSLQTILRLHRRKANKLETLHEKFVIQLNDTHPTIAIAELMRLLVDENDLEWDVAWDITRRCFAYTNHTLLPEALEKWPIALFQKLLPRHLEIVFEINERFLQDVRKRFPGDEELVRRVSIIDEAGERYIRMAHLACVGSSYINGVAELHTNLLRENVLHDFSVLYPDKFTNVTNGVTPRRWLALSNPELSELITESVGEGWIKDLEQLRGLEKFVKDTGFQDRWRAIKHKRKEKLAAHIKDRTGLIVDPSSIFDTLVKRIHEYKRQHLNILHVITLYNKIKQGKTKDLHPRTFLFGGKAAPGYFIAKLIIKLINSVADVVNNDPAVNEYIKVAFLPDFNVQLGQKVYPAADVSEQISTAGKEASGTGNMKFALNGALTIGTMDGANIEIREEVGAENFFLFGLTAEEVMEIKAEGYNPRQYYEKNEDLALVLNQLASGTFSDGNPHLFKPIVESLLTRDDFMLLVDYQSYVDCQKTLGGVYLDKKRWTEMSILNVARMGKFSSDRSIRDYCEKIWHVNPFEIDMETYAQDTAELTVKYCRVK